MQTGLQRPDRCAAAGTWPGHCPVRLEQRHNVSIGTRGLCKDPLNKIGDRTLIYCHCYDKIILSHHFITGNEL